MSNRIGNNLVHFGSNEELVRALVDHKVKFIVIGGLAVAWHCPERVADDMDLLVEPTIENSERITRALTSLRIGGLSENSFFRSGLQVPIKDVFYAELLTPQEGLVGFNDVEADAVDACLFEIHVRLASIAKLLAMKKQAIDSNADQREKHLKDIELLTQRSR